MVKPYEPVATGGVRGDAALFTVPPAPTRFPAPRIVMPGNALEPAAAAGAAAPSFAVLFAGASLEPAVALGVGVVLEPRLPVPPRPPGASSSPARFGCGDTANRPRASPRGTRTISSRGAGMGESA